MRSSGGARRQVTCVTGMTSTGVRVAQYALANGLRVCVRILVVTSIYRPDPAGCEMRDARCEMTGAKDTHSQHATPECAYGRSIV